MRARMEALADDWAAKGLLVGAAEIRLHLAEPTPETDTQTAPEGR